MFNDKRMDIYFENRMGDVSRETYFLIENLSQYEYFLKQYKQKKLFLITGQFFDFVSKSWYESMILRLNKLNDKKDSVNKPYSFYEVLDRLIIEVENSKLTSNIYKKSYPGTSEVIISNFFNKNGEVRIEKIIADRDKLNNTIKNIAEDSVTKYFRHMDKKYSGEKIKELKIPLVDIKKAVSLLKKYNYYYYPFLTGKSFLLEPQKSGWGIIFRTYRQAEKIRRKTRNRLLQK